MSESTHLMTWVTRETKDRFAHLAHEQGYSESAFFEALGRLRIPADGGQGFQSNVDTDSSATWTEFRRDGGQFLR
jgi:hypothetical protein